MSASERLERLEAGAFAAPWFAVVNDLVGGWMVASRDVPAHALRFGPGGDRCLADFSTEDEARFIATLRNALPELVAVVKAAKECADWLEMQSSNQYGRDLVPIKELDAALDALDRALAGEQA